MISFKFLNELLMNIAFQINKTFVKFDAISIVFEKMKCNKK